MKKTTVFLGGTCNHSTWRDRLIPMLVTDYFNPMKDEWTPEMMAEEEKHQREDDVLLYVITPKMVGVFTIAELIEASNKRPERVIACALQEDDGMSFDGHMWKSIVKSLALAEKNGAKIANSLEEVADLINARNNSGQILSESITK